jgi:predicted CoA-binding protein
MLPDQNPRDDEVDEDDEAVAARLLDSRRVAVVGLSDDPSRASFQVANYLQSHGFDIVPVNPHALIVLGVHCAATLADVEGPVDLVNVFRRAEYCPQIVRDAIAVGAKGVWLQSGIRSEEARALAEGAGMDYVEDRCLMVEHARRG